ncbi:hypothetical protein EVAR_101635_1 [Eumeta japonica]|uniref:Uncharacterized protein n=1 Tax=Eumeta variegata TaxID=151549 RepID=A0A4C2A804_EUMVA|nr:hypothetical protein EVAR_101635_1 [Eumeta japonica]
MKHIHMLSGATTSLHHKLQCCNRIVTSTAVGGAEFEDFYVTKPLYTSLVRPVLKYASVAWDPAYVTHIQSIESAQMHSVVARTAVLRCFLYKFKSNFPIALDPKWIWSVNQECLSGITVLQLAPSLVSE